MKCPGQDTRYWKSGSVFEVNCPKCNHPVEFFKDDTSRICGNCKHRFVNPKMDFGCAAYCQYAEHCIGNLPPELLAQKESLFKDRVAIEMKKYFGKDFKRIGHASRVARYAQAIANQEGGDMAVILAAAYLHDIGIHEAEKKYQSTAARYQEKEGPPIARQIMEKLGAKDTLIDEVCDIVGHHHHPRESETLNFKVLYDSDLIVNLEDQHKEKPISSERLTQIINKKFFTKQGQNEAKKALLK
ncbi:HD family phosphohydrolase [Candidatus Magnetomorum sp. HK-1]|nr:HD family phosphohydrolase [Candidatus Magnetomorum sp. HK-1]